MFPWFRQKLEMVRSAFFYFVRTSCVNDTFRSFFFIYINNPSLSSIVCSFFWTTPSFSKNFVCSQKFGFCQTKTIKHWFVLADALPNPYPYTRPTINYRLQLVCCGSTDTILGTLVVWVSRSMLDRSRSFGNLEINLLYLPWRNDWNEEMKYWSSNFNFPQWISRSSNWDYDRAGHVPSFSSRSVNS